MTQGLLAHAPLACVVPALLPHALQLPWSCFPGHFLLLACLRNLTSNGAVDHWLVWYKCISIVSESGHLGTWLSFGCHMMGSYLGAVGGLRHSLRPKRPPSYPLKEESPPPQGPSRQSHSGSRQGQGTSRTSSGLSQKAQAAAARPTQKARHRICLCIDCLRIRRKGTDNMQPVCLWRKSVLLLLTVFNIDARQYDNCVVHNPVNTASTAYCLVSALEQLRRHNMHLLANPPTA